MPSTAEPELLAPTLPTPAATAPLCRVTYQCSLPFLSTVRLSVYLPEPPTSTLNSTASALISPLELRVSQAVVGRWLAVAAAQLPPKIRQTAAPTSPEIWLPTP